MEANSNLHGVSYTIFTFTQRLLLILLLKKQNLDGETVTNDEQEHNYV